MNYGDKYFTLFQVIIFSVLISILYFYVFKSCGHAIRQDETETKIDSETRAAAEETKKNGSDSIVVRYDVRADKVDQLTKLFKITKNNTSKILFQNTVAENWIDENLRSSINIKIDNSSFQAISKLVNNNSLYKLNVPNYIANGFMGNSEVFNRIQSFANTERSQNCFSELQKDFNSGLLSVNLLNIDNLDQSFKLKITNKAFSNNENSLAYLDAVENQFLNLFVETEQNQNTKIVLLEESTSIVTVPISKTYSEDAIPELKNLDISDFKNFYVFDHFEDGKSTHGEKVMDVVRQVLNENSLDYALSKVFEIPINYYDNIDKGDSIYYDWYIKTNHDERTSKKFLVIDSISLSKLSAEAKADSTPSNYLTVIYAVALNSEPDIISSSYIGRCDKSYLYDPVITAPGSNTNYITASLNDPLDIDNYDFHKNDNYMIDNKKQIERNIQEPLSTYIESYSKRGIVIVGNQVAEDSFINMFSGSGRFITALGKGKNWGKESITKYITATDCGASFATPEVATKLFIAKAYWRKNNLKINSIEARNRLLLSTNLNKNFVGKFTSGGSISLEKLIQKDKAYTVSQNNNETIALDSVIDGYIVNEQDNTHQDFSLNGLRGIYKIGDTFFAINSENENSNLKAWKKINEPSKIFIYGRTAKTKQDIVITKNDFLNNKYKQFVFLQK